MRKFIVKILTFLKPSFTGTDGKSEESKFAAWIILGLIVWATKHIIETPSGITMIHIYLLGLLAVLYLLLIGVLKFQEIIEAVKNIKRDGAGNQV
jgi:hypothetical protein